MDFQLRYFKWFLANYTNYRYNGSKAKQLKKEIDSFYLSQDMPNTRELRLLYAKFLVQYRGDVLTTTNREGIHPKKADYYLMFEVEDYLVPLNFIAYYQRVDNSYLQEVLKYLIEQRTKIYSEVIVKKNHLVEKNDITIRRTDNYDREFVILKENLISFAFLFIIPLIITVSLFIPEVVFHLQITFWHKLLIQSSMFVLSFLYGMVICGFIADNQTILKGKQINLALFDLEKDLNEAIRKLNNLNLKSLCLTISSGKSVHSKIREPKYDKILAKYDKAIDELEKGKIIKSKLKKNIFEVSNAVLDISIVFTYLAVYFGADLAEWISGILALFGGIGVFFLVRGIVKKVNIKVVLGNAFASLLVSILFMVIIGSVIGL